MQNNLKKFHCILIKITINTHQPLRSVYEFEIVECRQLQNSCSQSSVYLSLQMA